MSLEIIQRDEDVITVLDLKGELVFGEEDASFRSALDALFWAGKTRVLLNLTDLSNLDTAGLDTLLASLAQYRTAGGNIAVYSTKPSHLGLLPEARLETSLQIFNSEEAAAAGLFPDLVVKDLDVLEYVRTQGQG